MTLRSTAKQAVRWMAPRVGLGGALDRYDESHHQPYWHHRDEIDNRNLRLLMRFTLRPDANCIDVGAHKGTILANMVEFAPDGHHIAFEPLPYLAKDLQHQYPAVQVRSVALANRRGHAEFLHVVNAPALSGLADQQMGDAKFQTESIEVSVDRLDDCLPAGYAPDFVKIDAEGSELDILLGGLETLRRHHPAIVFEHQRGAAGKHGIGPREVHPLLTGAGYEIFDIDGGGPYTVDWMVEVFESGLLWTWVALPRDATSARTRSGNVGSRRGGRSHDRECPEDPRPKAVPAA